MGTLGTTGKEKQEKGLRKGEWGGEWVVFGTDTGKNVSFRPDAEHGLTKGNKKRLERRKTASEEQPKEGKKGGNRVELR